MAPLPDSLTAVQFRNAGNGLCDRTRPFLIAPIRREVTIQQVWRDIELMIAVRCRLVFTSSYDRYAVLTHQPAYAAVPYIQTNFLQLFGHTRPATLGTLLRNTLPCSA